MPLIPDLRDQLLKVFSPPQADVLTSVVTQAYDSLVTKSDLYELRDVVREMADAQKATDRRIAKLTETTDRRFAETNERLEKLTEITDRRFAETNERLEKLTETTDRRIAELTETTDRRITELTETTDRRIAETNDQLTTAIETLCGQMRRFAITQDELVGPVHELKVAAHLAAYVGRAVRGCIVLDSRSAAQFFDDLVESGALSEDEIDDIRRADTFATAKLDGEPVILVVEASRTGDEYDIVRTARRADTLSRAGTRAIPILACLHIDPDTLAHARQKGVWVIRKGQLIRE